MIALSKALSFYHLQSILSIIKQKLEFRYAEFLKNLFVDICCLKWYNLKNLDLHKIIQGGK